ncbi:MAG: hypothetical protein U9R44_01640 [Candidatus Omnitrophota bacterium]|nr:hypothetical protein [Candidatus Omnitrophota bacterium]
MILYLILVVLFAIITLVNYRRGLPLLLILGLLADPLRKMTPENPVYINVLFVPVFLIMYFTVTGKSRKDEGFLHYYPETRNPLRFLILILIVNSVRPILAGISNVPVLIYSLVQYLGILMAIKLGFLLAEKDKDVERFVRLFPIIVAPFLFTVLISFFMGDKRPLILNVMGIEKFPEWMIHGGGYGTARVGEKIVFLCGLFRNPEPMGWFAFIACVCALLVIFKNPKKVISNIFYYAIAIMGIFCVYVSGRRKFLLGITIFAVTFALLALRRSKQRAIIFLIVCMVLLGGVSYSMGKLQGEQRRLAGLYEKDSKTGYRDAIDEWKRRVGGSIKWAIKRDGFWGRGFGATTQGGRRFRAQVSGPGIESGSGKLLSEWGFPGLICITIIVYLLCRKVYANYTNALARSTSFPAEEAFLIALSIAHVAEFLLSHQIYADPLIGVLTGVTLGALLAVPKWQKDQ